MKRLLLSLFLLSYAVYTIAQGIPFLRNYSAKEYRGNNINFDLEIGDDGTVFVANFEGVLYYDNAEWRMINTPELTRVTVIYKDQKGTIWAGGYNFFGKIIHDSNGVLSLKRIGKERIFRGEIQEIWEGEGTINFLVNDGRVYSVQGSQVVVKKQIERSSLNIGLTDIVQLEKLKNDNKIVVLTDTTQVEPLDNYLKAIVLKGRGLVIADGTGHDLYSLTEANGLCSNNISYVAYNGHGRLWGVTDNGIFTVSIPSAYHHFTLNEGLSGTVMSICEFGGKLYVATLDGLFRLEGNVFVKDERIKYGCWKTVSTPMGLFAATANGVYCLYENGQVRQLTKSDATSLLVDGSVFYSGEEDGIYQYDLSGNHRKIVCSQDRAVRIVKDNDGSFWIQSLYGEVWHKKAGDAEFRSWKHKDGRALMASIVQLNSGVKVVSIDDTEPFSYAQFSYLDESGITWLTDADSKSLYQWKDGKRLKKENELLFPIKDVMVTAMYQRGHTYWIGSENGLLLLDTSKKLNSLTVPRLLFRSVVMNGDSILWGGYGKMPMELPEFDSRVRNLRFTYSLVYSSLIGKTMYRYKLNNDHWSAWSEETDLELLNPSYGNYTLTIQARLATGQLSDETSLSFSVPYPFYMRWYMNIVYVLLLFFVSYVVFRYRTRLLEREKVRLEDIVQRRTAEVVSQKNEIEEKSKSLEHALNELHSAQGELIRQEKMATVGKLTQGLIDRILNPLNYINNFSKLSSGLVKDIDADVEDVKDNVDSDIYDDMKDIIGMLQGNLQKVSEHGENTTRTLKAMEEMLKDRSGGIVKMNLTTVLHQDTDMLRTYYSEDIQKYKIQISFDYPKEDVFINGNAEQLSKTFMSLLGNSVYAVVKKSNQTNYVPEIRLQATLMPDHVKLSIHDNGIGIEEGIINKVFDPFFTTKTVGEAAGVGLYLSREIIQSHGGDIQVESVKNSYTKFTIMLPALKA